MPKPINSQTVAAQQAAQQRTEQPKPQTVKIGGVEYEKEQIKSVKEYTQNGQTRYSVFLKPGVKLDYPTQNDPSKSPSVRNTGLSDKWYERDKSYINIFDLDNATITGCKNQSDFIDLSGRSSNNTIIVDEKESTFTDESMRMDWVDLGFYTSNNTVKMDEEDHLGISYHDKDKEYGVHILGVDGAGTSEQEVQLEHDLGKDKYNYHKNQQKKE